MLLFNHTLAMEAANPLVFIRNYQDAQQSYENVITKFLV